MKKMISILLVLLLVCSLFCGCGAKLAERDFATNEMMEAPAEDFAYTDALYGDIVLENGYDPEKAPEVGKTDNSVAANRKLIRRLSLSVETENYTELLSKIDAQVRACGGYVENMEASTRYSSTTRYATLVIRVPVDQLDSFAGYVGGVLMINPGAFKMGSYCMLTIDKGDIYPRMLDLDKEIQGRK